MPRNENERHDNSSVYVGSGVLLKCFRCVLAIMESRLWNADARAAWCWTAGGAAVAWRWRDATMTVTQQGTNTDVTVTQEWRIADVRVTQEWRNVDVAVTQEWSDLIMRWGTKNFPGDDRIEQIWEIEDASKRWKKVDWGKLEDKKSWRRRM